MGEKSRLDGEYMANKVFLGIQICTYNPCRDKKRKGLGDFREVKGGLTRYDRGPGTGARTGHHYIRFSFAPWPWRGRPKRSAGEESHPSRAARRVGSLANGDNRQGLRCGGQDLPCTLCCRMGPLPSADPCTRFWALSPVAAKKGTKAVISANFRGSAERRFNDLQGRF